MKGARTPRRRTWADMDHDDALLWEQVVRPKGVDELDHAERDLAEGLAYTCAGYLRRPQRATSAATTTRSATTEGRSIVPSG